MSGDRVDPMSHPGVDVGVGAYDGPNTGNRWYDDNDEVEDYEKGGASGKDISKPQKKYEYLDHTADVQIHCWGENLKEAFEQAAVAMYGYITEDIETVDMVDLHSIKAEGDDLEGLLFHFLDELLFIFSAQPFFIARKVVIEEFNLETFTITASALGEQFDLHKHPAGTEIKAITYSAMQILQKSNGDETTEDHEVEMYIIVDI